MASNSAESSTWNGNTANGNFMASSTSQLSSSAGSAAQANDWFSFWDGESEPLNLQALSDCATKTTPEKWCMCGKSTCWPDIEDQGRFTCTTIGLPASLTADETIATSAPSEFTAIKIHLDDESACQPATCSLQGGNAGASSPLSVSYDLTELEIPAYCGLTHHQDYEEDGVPSTKRKKRSKEDSVESPTTSTTSKTSKKQAHSIVERRYRETINSRLQLLRKTLQEVSDAQVDGESTNDVNVKPTRKVEVLLEAIKYVKSSEASLKQLNCEVAFLRARVQTLEKLVKCEDCSLLNSMVKMCFKAPQASMVWPEAARS